MPIILITGANGHGKGQFAIKTILDLQYENDKREKQGLPRRQIYANIHGINQANVKPLKDVLPIPSDKIFFGKQDNLDDPPPQDYFIPPIGSIFFYDECQKEDWVKQKSGALSNDPRVRSLEEHRHAGHDIYFITQSPNYIHSHIQGLVSPHFYVERPLGLKTTNVFVFNTFQKSPQSPTTKNKADDQFMISLGEKYGQYYKSSAEHNMKSTIPKKLKIAVGFFLFILSLTLYKGIKANEAYEVRNREIKNQNIQSQSKNSIPVNTAVMNELENLKQELEKLKAQKELDDYNKRMYYYHNHLSDDYEVIKSDPNLQVRGVIKIGKTCQAYNTHGDIMTLSYDECDYYIQEPGRVHKSPNQLTEQKKGAL